MSGSGAPAERLAQLRETRQRLRAVVSALTNSDPTRREEAETLLTATGTLAAAGPLASADGPARQEAVALGRDLGQILALLGQADRFYLGLFERLGLALADYSAPDERRPVCWRSHLDFSM